MGIKFPHRTIGTSKSSTHSFGWEWLAKKPPGPVLVLVVPSVSATLVDAPPQAT